MDRSSSASVRWRYMALVLPLFLPGAVFFWMGSEMLKFHYDDVMDRAIYLEDCAVARSSYRHAHAYKGWALKKCLSDRTAPSDATAKPSKTGSTR